MNKRGAVFVVFVFAVGAFFVFLMGAIELTRKILEVQRKQAWMETTVLSSLRVRAKALGTVADRWETFGRTLGPADEAGVYLERSKWTGFIKASDQLSGSLGGYQGRTSAVVTVLAGIYGLPREEILVEDRQAPKLGILAQPFLLRDEAGDHVLIPAGWYKRLWEVDVEKNPIGTLRHSFQGIGAGARLIWDVDRDDPLIRQQGNGGYPLTWDDARVGNTLQPNRTAHYRAELVEDP